MTDFIELGYSCVTHRQIGKHRPLIRQSVIAAKGVQLRARERYVDLTVTTNPKRKERKKVFVGQG